MIPVPLARTGVLLLRWNDGVAHGPRAARDALREALCAVGVPPGVNDDAVQAAAELIANAVEHAVGPYELWLRSTARELICEVHDGDAAMPRWDSGNQQPDPLSERGRGLCVVDELTAGCWGFRLRGGAQRATWRKVAWMAIPAE